MSEKQRGALAGRTLGGYRLTGLLGTGGMAEVYRGEDLRLGRAVAVKVLAPSRAAEEEFIRRFRVEAQRVAALRHPNIVPVYQYDEQKGLLFLVMPLLEESLRERMRRVSRVPIDESMRTIVQIAAALDAAHAQGIIHRDVKPENIMFDAEGNALLTDFGIARQMLPETPWEQTPQTISEIGLPIGTPEYMAPEQLRMSTVDGRADIYALGAVLYELLTDRAPHEAATPIEVAALTLSAPVVPPSIYNPEVWPELEAVVLMALAYEPRDRFQRAGSFGEALRNAATHYNGGGIPSPMVLMGWQGPEQRGAQAVPSSPVGGAASQSGAGYAGPNSGAMSYGGVRSAPVRSAPGGVQTTTWATLQPERRRVPWALAALLVLALISVVGCSALFVTGKLPGGGDASQVPTRSATHPGGTGPLGQTATPGASSIPGSPGVDGTPTATSTGTVTATPEGTPTDTPVVSPTATVSSGQPMLSVSPSVMLLNHQSGTMCQPSNGNPAQTVTNPGTQPMNVQYSGFPLGTAWDYTGSYNNLLNNLLLQPSFSSLAGGNTIPFYIEVPCSTGDHFFNVTLTDSLGRVTTIQVHTFR